MNADGKYQPKIKNCSRQGMQYISNIAHSI